tara:strand:- start:496 stop:2352 length:1857 start_codon:yes stop_codon:yes gene_type:complete
MLIAYKTDFVVSLDVYSTRIQINVGYHDDIVYAMNMKTLLLSAFICIGGCSVSNNTRIAGPEGPRPNEKTWVTPKDVPTIDLTEDNVPDFWTATPTIIDTNTFANRHQITGPIPGKHPRPSKFLPAHKKPQFNEQGPPNSLLAGIGNTTTTIHNQSGFNAIANTVWNPPDPSLAVGPNHIVATVNMAIAFYDKDGNEEFSAMLNDSGNPGFFEDVGAGGFTFDPKCFYDQHAERFVVLALEQYGSDESWITMAVSDDNDPNGVWYKYRTWSVVTDASSGDTFWVDYPGFGFDDGYYYITGNLFGLNGGSGWGGVLYRVMDKAPMLIGDPVVVADIRQSGHASMQCAQHYGDAPSAFFVGRRNNTELRVSHIDDPSNPSVVSEFVSVPNHGTPGSGVPNPGGTISALDGRIMNSHYRDGSLWTTHGVSGTSVNAVGRWYEIDVSDWPTASSTLKQSGDTTVPNSMSSFFPAIAANKRGEVAVVVATANNTTNPTLQIMGRKGSDDLGLLGQSTVVAVGNAGADGRWGDYFDMTVDPNNDTVFWYIGEVQNSSGWQTYIGSAIITCVEDVNADGAVNVSDVLQLIAGWGTGGDGAEVAAPYDLIDVSDVLAVVGMLGNCP